MPNAITRFLKDSFVVLAATACYGLFTTFIALSKEGGETTPYNKAATFILAEGVKLVMSLMFLVLENSSVLTAISNILSLKMKDWFLFATPALMYAVSNNIDYYLLEYMDPGSAGILKQFGILTTAVVWLLVFKKTLQAMQWQGLFLLMVGSGLVAFVKHDGENQMYVRPMGLVFLVFQQLFSACAGVYNEWVYKEGSGQDVSIHLQNLGMYSWGITFQALYFFKSKSDGKGLLDGFNKWTWAVVFIYAFKGLLVSQIFKHYSVIVKLLVNGAAMFVANFFTWYLFGLQTSLTHILGLVTVLIALLRYNQDKIEQAMSPGTKHDYEMKPIPTVSPSDYIDTDSSEEKPL